MGGPLTVYIYLFMEDNILALSYTMANIAQGSIGALYWTDWPGSYDFDWHGTGKAWNLCPSVPAWYVKPSISTWHFDKLKFLPGPMMVTSIFYILVKVKEYVKFLLGKGCCLLYILKSSRLKKSHGFCTLAILLLGWGVLLCVIFQIKWIYLSPLTFFFLKT